MADNTIRAKYRTPEQLAKQKAQRKNYEEGMKSTKKNVQKALDTDDMVLLADCLPPMQKRFCEEYIQDWNACQAAIRAGTVSKYPAVVASQWRANPGVKRYIAFLMEERTNQFKLDQGYFIQKMVRALEKAEKDNRLQDIRQLSMDLMKALGMLSDKIEHTGKDGESIKIEQMKEDADALERAIASISKRGGTEGVPKRTQH